MNPSPTHKWSTTQINLPREQARSVLTWGRLNITAQDLAEDGFENEPHVTVLYGLEDGRDVVERIATETSPIAVALRRVKLLRQADQDVVVVGILSPGLRRLHWRLRAALPHHNKYFAYLPHCTIAYVKKGAADDLEGSPILSQGGEVALTFNVDFLVWRGRDGSSERFQFKGKLTEEQNPFAELPFPADATELRRGHWKRRLMNKKTVL
jgi:2'-5' RNA ligase